MALGIGNIRRRLAKMRFALRQALWDFLGEKRAMSNTWFLRCIAALVIVLALCKPALAPEDTALDAQLQALAASHQEKVALLRDRPSQQKDSFHSAQGRHCPLKRNSGGPRQTR